MPTKKKNNPQTLGTLAKSISGIKTNQIAYILLLVAVFLIGYLVARVQILEKGGSGQTALDSQAAPQQPTGPVDVSIDDDAVLGDKNAKVTIIDFTDYECPFCKRYAEETYPQIKKDYIDTGKVRYVVRDLPLSFHQNAHKEAQAAECARVQGGDEAYFKYHDEMFKRTTSNGTGLALDQLSVIANELGLNGATLQTCLDTDKYKTEMDKNFAYS